jgi:dihydrodipicolinate synthase/N-acetylneuraminate lyase
MKLQGIFAALATPFDYKGEIYKVKVQHNVEKWNKVALTGYAVATGTGEGGLLTFEERVELWKLVKQAAASDRVLLADVTREGVKESVLLAQRAAQIGYHGILCSTPFVADSSPLPIVTGLPIILGSAAGLLSALQEGAPGAILGFASAAPYACIALWEAFRTREAEAALDWQSRIVAPSELVAAIGALKHAMDLNGYYGGSPRLPLSPPTPAVRKQIEVAFRDLKG